MTRSPIVVEQVSWSEQAIVLVLAHETHIQRYLCTTLEASGYRPMAAPTVPVAMGLAGTKLPDVMVVDLLLPGENGLEVIRELRSTHPAAPLLAVCDCQRFQVTAAFLALAREFGAEATLELPCEPSALLDAVRNCLGRQ